MSLQFYLGSSGSGKSHALHRMITARADRERDRNFLFIVPDQFTMQTQIDLVNASERGGILNVDVLSFGRLAHRIFEETGAGSELVLDDTGKNLILRSLAGSLQDKLPVLGKHLGKPGYIHEIKSVLSEFKQYDISCEKLEELIAFGSRRGMLGAKLKDLAVINEAFNNYTRDRYVTTEETMTLLTEVLDRSEIIRGAVVVFDGFTGFTPVQYRLISRLLELTEQVIVSITVDTDAGPYGNPAEQELFYLSKQTIRKLQDCARETNTRLDEDVLFSGRYRFEKAPALSHLERSVFRYPLKPCPGEINEISITEAPDILTEVREVCLRIRELVLEQGYTYRDIAVVCADLPSYADAFRLFAPVYDLPVFIDETVRLSLNPFTESLRSALLIVRDGFSYASVFHYLRCGAGALLLSAVDRLDNYVLACGIRGEKAYREAFTRIPAFGPKKNKEITEEELSELESLNESRRAFYESMSPLLGKLSTAADYAEALKAFIDKNDLESLLLAYAERFTKEGDRERAREYTQVCGLIRKLLDQIAALLPEEKIGIDEFIELFDAGLSEIDVGTLPGGVDRIIVGDTERSRLAKIRILFLLGANDGSIPRANKGGGLISDIDREFLKKSEIPLSPTPREQIYIQRFYLYLCMTKPGEALHVSFSRTNGEGNAAKESYLIPMMLKLFPDLTLRKAKAASEPFASVAGVRDGASFLSEALRKRMENGAGNTNLSENEIVALSRVLLDSPDPEVTARTKGLFAASSFTYKPETISEKLSSALYGETLSGSISRIETFSACAYRHFLSYGIGLTEREERIIRPTDTGNIYHETLERFAKALAKHGYTLADFPDEEGMRILKEVLDEVCTGYHEVLFFGSKKSEYMIRQMESILRRTVSAFRIQLKGGSFRPASFEYAFTENVDIGIPQGAKMKLRGRIDRIDLLKDNDCNYLKIIDFKSGSRQLEMDSLYYGLQLQLPFYMRAAVREFEKRSGGVPVKPAAMFYYHIKDPLILSEGMIDEDAVNEKICMELRPSGIISSDEKVLTGLDRDLASDSSSSLLVPVSKNTDGTISSYSSVLDEDMMGLLGDFAEKSMKRAGQKILSGSIGIDPKVHRNRDACTYCAFGPICPYDEKTPGYVKKELPSMKKEEAVELIRQETGNKTGEKTGEENGVKIGEEIRVKTGKEDVKDK